MSKSSHYYIYGVHTLQALLERTPERVLNVSITQGKHDDRIGQLLREIERHGIALQRVSDKQLDKQSDAMAFNLTQ